MLCILTEMKDELFQPNNENILFRKQEKAIAKMSMLIAANFTKFSPAFVNENTREIRFFFFLHSSAKAIKHKSQGY